MNNLHIWLAYVAYPITTAVYFERALRQRCRTTTIGPPLPHELIEKWQLQNLKLPLRNQEISTSFTPDMAEIISTIPAEQIPDLYLWIESVGGYYPLNLDAIPCPKICYLIDSHHNLSYHLEWAKEFDLVFIAQREYLDEFHAQGIRAHWLPLGCDPEIHCHLDVAKVFQVGFEGGVSNGSRREALLNKLASQIQVHYDRCFWEERAKLFSESKMIFNSAAKNDLNMRNFEVMSAGTMVLTDMAKNSGQNTLFIEGEDYAVYNDQNIIDVAQFYLTNEDLREKIAARGQRLVHNAHTIGHRVNDLLAVTLGHKPDTFSAEELRQRSLAGVSSFYDETINDISTGASPRSFVIPVLDYSPASEYNIMTLLDDLKEIAGDVIIIFNGSSVGEALKNHPRVTRHAIMKQNIGVARGWNIGLNMAETDIVFILNADVHISLEAISKVERGLKTLPQAACVGPQGAYVNFHLCRDYKYFDKGSFSQPLEVDAVSGFFFAVNRRLFAENNLQFENDFTPCYFEEWDIGLQIKRAGLKNYIVPTSAYDHHWSGTIRALHTIPYMGRNEKAGDILLRNRRILLAKWRHIVRRLECPELLESCWKNLLLEDGNSFFFNGDFAAATEISDSLNRHFQNDAKVRAFTRMLNLHNLKSCTNNQKP